MTKPLSDVLRYLMSSIKHRNKSFLKQEENLKLDSSLYRNTFKFAKLKKNRELRRFKNLKLRLSSSKLKRLISARKWKEKTKFVKKLMITKEKSKPLLLDFKLLNKKAMNKKIYTSKLNNFNSNWENNWIKFKMMKKYITNLGTEKKNIDSFQG